MLRHVQVHEESQYQKYYPQEIPGADYDSDHEYAIAENHPDRDLSAQATGQKRVSGLTYIRTPEGWLYLRAILDLADRKVVGWADLR